MKYELHGMRYTPEYRSYAHAKARCQCETDAKYSIYGARGIEFKFTSFKQFLKEVGERPSSQHSIERINNNGHYELGNVRWATAREQGLNKRLHNNNTSGYRGVSQHWRSKKFTAYIRANNKALYLGEYETPEEAAYIRDQFAQQIYGEDYKTNLAITERG